MASNGKHKSWAALVAVLIAVAAAAVAHATSVDLSNEGLARAFARRSDARLAEGTKECKEMAEYYPTLGAAFRWHERRANAENRFQCRRAARRWTCKASFTFNDKKESEREWALILEFSVEESGKVSGLSCQEAE